MPGGRPRKHTTAEARAEARQRSNHKDYLRRKNRHFQPRNRPDFIFYEPQSPTVTSVASSDLGLQPSATLPVLQDSLNQPHDVTKDKRVYYPPPPHAPTADEHPHLAVQDDQPCAIEQEQTNMRDGCRIMNLQQVDERDVRAAEIMLELQAGIVYTDTRAVTMAERSEGTQPMIYSVPLGLMASKQPLRTPVV
jgi:hypothetical protein